MARKKMFTVERQKEIIDYYLKGFSTAETGRSFGVTGATVYNICKKHGVKLRSVAEGNALKWENEEFRENQINKKKGRTSAALGKTWKLNHIKKSPNIKGENNPNWKGGKTKLSTQIRMSSEYSFWRMSVFRRDNWTCQICGAKNKKGEKYIFDADHIHPFSKIIDEQNITSMEEAISCKQLWDIDNGRTLCRECHKKTDTWGVNQYTK